MLFASIPTVSDVSAQCPPLTNGTCLDTQTVPQDFSFTQNLGYWMVVGVVPAEPDDKDIYLFTGCGGTGSFLAGSSGMNGADFIIGDFNHNPSGTYYPRVQYGSQSDPYTVMWMQGGKILPVSAPEVAYVGGTSGSCAMFDVWDVFLQAGEQYQFRFTEPAAGEAHLALFRNPGSTTFWAPRSAAEFEMTGTGAKMLYSAPESDWYGIVVFPTWRQSIDQYSIEVEKLFDCEPLVSGTCVETELLPNAATGPEDNYSFEQGEYYWSVVAVVPEETDSKAVEVYTECDENGTKLAASAEGTGETSLIMMDFTHTPLSVYCPVISNGSVTSPFTLEWEEGGVLFPVPGEMMGSFDAMAGNPNIVQVWDVHVEAGKEYEFFFYNYGDADAHLALFRNCSTTPYWAPRSYAEWEVSGTGGIYRNYTAPTTDYLGLVAFADAREQYGFYQVQIQELNDCVPLGSMACTQFARRPRDFSFETTGNYWAVVGIFPAEGDDKNLYVTTQCDGKGSLLASSSSSGTNFVVGDFNHMPPGTFYAHSQSGDLYMEYLASCDVGVNPDEDLFPTNEVIEGGMVPGEGDCMRIRIWDVFLESGQTYTASFTRSGTADIRLSLFANPGNGTYWSGRSGRIWEMIESGNHTFTAPASDWYGLVVFPDSKEGWGNYTIRITPEGVTAAGTVPVKPERFALYQNAPNPFNPSTLIRYDVPSDGARVILRVYDVQGRPVHTLFDGMQSAGEKTLAWDGRDDNGILVPSGVYFYRMETDGFSETRKMLLIR